MLISLSSALCRAGLLIDQILRIDLKSHTVPTSSRLSDTQSRRTTPPVIKQMIPNGKSNGPQTLPMPVLRTQPQTLSGRLSTVPTQEKTGFKPVIHQPIENHSRPPSVRPQTSSVDEYHLVN